MATARFAAATTIALAVVAVLAPFLGALADYAAARKKLLAAFLGLGVLATACMVFIQRGDWGLACVLFIVGNIGASGSFIFYDSLLPHIASDAEMDRVSTAGYALGYLGGGLLLALNLAWIQQPGFFGIADAAAAARLSFLSVAVWWLGFSLPLFRYVAEPPRRLEADERRDMPLLRAVLAQLSETVGELRAYKQAVLLLVAFLLYNDGIGTIIRMATLYGTQVGIDQGGLIGALLLTQFIGVPAAFLFGAVASKVGAKPAILGSLVLYTVISVLGFRMKTAGDFMVLAGLVGPLFGSLAEQIGAKRAILFSLLVYIAISIIGYFMTTAWHFYCLAILVGMVQGGSQALSRSLFASLIPRYQSSEFFAFFAICEKFAGIFGPAIFAGMIMTTGSSRTAVLAVLLFFIAGGLLLALVDVPEGQRMARAAEAQARV